MTWAECEFDRRGCAQRLLVWSRVRACASKVDKSVAMMVTSDGVRFLAGALLEAPANGGPATREGRVRACARAGAVVFCVVACRASPAGPQPRGSSDDVWRRGPPAGQQVLRRRVDAQITQGLLIVGPPPRGPRWWARGVAGRAACIHTPGGPLMGRSLALLCCVPTRGKRGAAWRAAGRTVVVG